MECTTTVRLSDPVKQQVVTTFFMLSSSPGPSSTDWQALSDGMSALFYATTGAGTYPWVINGGRKGQTRVYNMADLKPRPEKGYTAYNPASPESATLGPREVALCLSYYADRNLPRQRGRVYLGPFLLAEIFERPDTTMLSRCLQLGKNLIAPPTFGTLAWQLCVWSRADAQARGVGTVWVNDVWDHRGERGQPETTRVHYP